MKIFSTLFFWRLKFYTLTTMSLLRRRMQAFIFIVLMLAPAATPVFALIHMLAMPVLALIHNKDPISALVIWGLILLTFAFWGGVQNKAVRGGGAQIFISTLPISSSLIIAVDVCFFAVVDIPILLPFIASIFTDEWGKKPPIEIIHQIGLIVSFAVSGILLQVLLLRNIKSAIIFLGISFLSPLLMTVSQIPFLAILPVLLLIYLLFKYSKFFLMQPKYKKWNVPIFKINPNSLGVVNFIRVSLRHLFFVELTARVGLIIFSLLPLFLWFLAKNNGWQTNITVSLLIIVLDVLVFQIGGMAFSLQNLHAPMLKYWEVQGVPKVYIYSAQLLSLLLAGMIACVPLLIIIGFISNLYSMVLIFPVILAGVALFSYVNRGGGQTSFVIKAAMGGLIAFSAWLLLVGY